MVGKYKAYAEYKDSGVEWLGEVPLHWVVTKLGQLAFMQEGPGLRNWQFKGQGTRVICVTNITEQGIDFSKLEKFISNEEYASSYRHFTVKNGDILLSSSGNSWGKVAEYISDETVILNTSTIRLNQLEHKRLRLNYIQYFLASEACREQLGVAMTGSCQPNFGPTHLKEIKTPIPTDSEQQKIANFLDHETAKIDTLIEKQQQLIALLKEKRQAVISHAVTKGLNPDAPLHDSGVEWLGEVPEHWELGRLKNVLRIRNGKDYKEVEVEEGGYPVYGSGGIFKRSSQYLYNGQSVLFGRKGTIDKPLVVSGKFWTVDTMFYSEVFDNALPEYIYYQASLFPFSQLSTNTALPSMTQEDLLELPFLIPPCNEQLEIIIEAQNKSNEFDNLIFKAESAIILMQERRTALISAAVTGKIDIRDWVAPEETKTKDLA